MVLPSGTSQFSSLSLLLRILSPLVTYTSRSLIGIFFTMSSTLSLTSISIALVLPPSTLTNIWTILRLFLLVLLLTSTQSVTSFLTSSSPSSSAALSFPFFSPSPFLPFSLFSTFLSLFSLPSFSFLHCLFCLLLWLVVISLLWALDAAVLCCCSRRNDAQFLPQVS